MEAQRNPIFLVPTDFSAVCANAANRAALVAKELNYKVTLLHVIDRKTKSALKKENKGLEAIQEQLHGLAKSLNAKYGVPVDTISREGDIFKTIAEVASEIGANLIFLGTHGKVGMQRVTGSFAMRVVLSSEIPTIITHNREFNTGFKKIVYPVTSYAGPWQKTKWAASVAKQFKAEIHLFHLPDESLEDVVIMTTNHFAVNDVKFKVIEAQKSSNFTKQVIDYATSINADLILILTDPNKSFTEFLMGSYDEEIMFNTSQIPVMCINPRDFNWKKIPR
jgi:nucleotide-binding universal stress UspA family protein